MSLLERLRVFLGLATPPSLPTLPEGPKVPKFYANPTMRMIEQPGGGYRAVVEDVIDIVLTDSMYRLLILWRQPMSIEDAAQQYRTRFSSKLTNADLADLLEESLLSEQMIIPYVEPV